MRKIMFSAIITPDVDEVTLEGLRGALQQLGSVQFTYGAVVETASAEGLTREAWIYIPFDDGLPFVQVAGPGECEGTEVTEEAGKMLQDIGVCIEMHAKYPRADRYGAPLYACDGDAEFAASRVGAYGFKVATKGVEIFAEDRGDDGGEEIWLKIALPA